MPATVSLLNARVDGYDPASEISFHKAPDMDHTHRTPDADTPAASRAALETSLELVRRARDGDELALERLCARYLPRLRRWAHGRTPERRRSLLDTDDLVQNTLMRTVNRIHDFEGAHEGAFQVYVRQVLLNQVRDQLRRQMRTPDQDTALELDEAEHPGMSPLEEAIGQDTVDRYEAAMARLRSEEREAIVARVEMGYSYAEVAEALGKPSADAARMAVGRALRSLAKEMGDE
jgi:RNA polymerase sigma-70 factor (ECF subfamily)